MQKRKLLAYYYPGFHSDEYRDWTEWAILKKAKPLFEGHYYNKKPYWGFYDDSKFLTFQKQVDTASKYGIDGFIFDTYWKPGDETVMSKPLWEFSSKIENKDFSVGVMWVPKFPRKRLPLKFEDKEDGERYFRFNSDVLIKLVDWLEPIINQGNYLQISGKFYLSIFYASRLFDVLGHKGLVEAIDSVKKYCLKKFKKEIYLIGIINDIYEAFLMKNVGFDALSSYIWLPNWNGSFIQDYNSLVKERFEDYSIINMDSDLKYYPVLNTGWDASPRGMGIQKGEKIPKSFPWHPIVINSTPNNVYRALKATSDYLDKLDSSEKFPLVISSWNEWSENHCIEPSSKYGHQYLEFIKKFKNES
jgi:hypothetical protein